MKENLIKSLIDHRMVEALKKKINQKLLTIAQFMGSPIVGEYSYSSMLPDFWEYEIDDPYDPEKIAEATENAGEQRLGYSYDSLRHGINFEILVRTYGESIHLIRATFNGMVVYLEEEGILKGYHPEPRWEQHMEDLFVHAKKLEDRFVKKAQEEETKESKARKKTFLEQLWLIWGYK
jgi:hypothetical protein